MCLRATILADFVITINSALNINCKAGDRSASTIVVCHPREIRAKIRNGYRDDHQTKCKVSECKIAFCLVQSYKPTSVIIYILYFLIKLNLIKSIDILCICVFPSSLLSKNYIFRLEQYQNI